MHRLCRINPSREANLTSHLTISYSASPTASSTPAAAPTADTTATDSPLGFLTALVDQLLSGGAAATPATDTTAMATTAGAPTTAGTPSLFNLGLQVQGQTPATASPQGVTLLKQLNDELSALQSQLDAGQKPDTDLLKKLGQTADALAALINVPPPQTTPPAIDPKTALDPLAAIASADPARPTAPTDDSAPAPSDGNATPSVPADQMAQLLAALGVAPAAPQQTATPAPVTTTDSVAPVAATAPAAPLAALDDFVQKLTNSTKDIAPTSPEISQKLAALTAKLASAEANPTLTAQVASDVATSQAGTPLDKIITALTAPKPADPLAATPQLASTTKLDIPAALVPSKPNDPTLDPVAAPTLAPKITMTPVAQTTAGAPAIKIDDAPATADKSDTKAVAAIAASVTDKTDAASSTSAASAAATPAPIAAAAPRAIPAAYQAAANPINMAQVAFEMVRQVQQGQSRFSIRLDPPELGRVDVKMHVDGAGNVNARLTVERSETLDMFQRDRGSLEKALSQAGVDTGKTNLEFSLKQNPFAGMTGSDQRGANSGYGGAGSFAANGNDDDATSIPSVTLYRGTASAGGVNLFV